MSQIAIDFNNGAFFITCPFYANDVVKKIPGCRWQAKSRCWKVAALRMPIEAIRDIKTRIEGVVLTAAANAALENAKTRGAPRLGGFPVWYPFKTRLKRADGTGVDEYPVYKHARAALDKKWGLTAFALHHDMGTAKTRTEIDYACALRMDGKIDAMLVLVKYSGRRNWKEQFCGPMRVGKDQTLYNEGWAPISADVLLPDADEQRAFDKWLDTPHDFKVMVAGVESLSSGRMPAMVERFLRGYGHPFGLVDESHLIANHKAIRSEHCFRFRDMCSFRDTTTGTPIKTAPLDLFGQFQWLDPEIIGIGDWYAFRNRYAVIVEQKTKAGKKFPLIVGYQNIDELTKAVAPYTDEVRKVDVLDLPPKNYLPHADLEPSKEQEAMADKLKKEGAYLLKGPEQRVVKNALELELRLHQVAQGFMPEYDETPYVGRKGDDRIRRTARWYPIVPISRNPKFLELEDLLRADRQFIIWVSYRFVLDRLVEFIADKYPKERIVEIHGDIKDSDRAAFRDIYQSGKAKFMVGNEATGGTSDTWTACETMVYYDNTNKLIDRLQSEDRAHRGGLGHTVDYKDLVIRKSPDALRLRAIGEKMNLSEYVRKNIRRAQDLLLEGIA